TPRTPEELQELLEALAELAPRVTFPAEPEVRIAGPHGEFLVQVRNGHVRVVSWSAQGGGSDLPPDRILAIIMGLEQDEGGARPRDGNVALPSPRSRYAKIALIGLVLIGSNSVTAWMLMRPPPPLPREVLSEYRLVAPERAARIFSEFA